MDKTKKILIACVAVLGVICITAVGMLIGMRMNQSKPAQAEEIVTEAVTEAQPEPELTEYVEPEIEETEPYEIATAEPTTQAPTTQPPTTKAPTTTRPATTKKVTTTAAPTTKATTTAAPTTKPTTTAAPTTKAPETTTANRGPFALIVHADSGAYDLSGAGRYSTGEFVKVSMTPRVGYTFVRWESSDTKLLPNSTSQTYVFQMPAASVSLHAVTKAQTLLTVNKGKGISYTSGSGYYTPGQKVTVTAQPETGYEFAGWTSSSSTGTASAGLTSNSTTFTFTMPERPITLTANAKVKSYNLRVYAGTGVRSVYGEGRYNYGDKVTLTVNMNDNYTLNRFDGLNATYNGNTVTFTMPAKDLTLTATGKANEKYIVTVTMDGGVRDVQGTGKYAPGDTVTVSCTLENGYKFVSWESSNIQLVRSSNARVFTFRMPSGDVNLIAHTEKEETQKYLLALERGSGVYSVDGSGYYAPGERVTVDCVMENGYTFTSWTMYSKTAVDEISTKRYTFTMPNGDVTLRANGKENTEEIVFG